MTATVLMRCPEHITIATDGASYDDDGICRLIRSKVSFYPEMPCVITSRGSGPVQHCIESALYWSQETLTFDDLIREMPAFSRSASEYVCAVAPPSNRDFSVFLAGWSPARERMETYVIRSYPWGEGEDPKNAPPQHDAHVLVPLPDFYFAPVPLPEIAQAFGVAVPPPAQLVDGAPQDTGGYALAAICAARQHRGGPAGEPDRCFVGGFVQVTTLTRTGIDTVIPHRWPDPVGQVLNPDRGQPSPWHSWPEAGPPGAEVAGSAA